MFSSNVLKTVLKRFAFCIAFDVQINRKGEFKLDFTLTNDTTDNDSDNTTELPSAIGFVLSSSQLNTSEGYEDETNRKDIAESRESRRVGNNRR